MSFLSSYGSDQSLRKSNYPSLTASGALSANRMLESSGTRSTTRRGLLVSPNEKAPDIDQALPFDAYRQLLVRLRNREYSRRMCRDLGCYLLFFLVYLVIIFLGRDQRSVYYLEQGVVDLTVSEEFSPEVAHIYKSFREIGHESEMWDWLEGPLQMSLSRRNADGQPVLLGQNHIIGSPRIRQVRVIPVCRIDPRLERAFSLPANYLIVDDDDDDVSVLPPLPQSTRRSENASLSTASSESNDMGEFRRPCFPQLDASSESKKSFGPAIDAERYRWTELNEPYVFGWVTNYPGDGFEQLLSLDPPRLQAQLQRMRNDSWIDQATRCLIVTLNVFNGNLNLFSSVRFVVEMNAGGGFTPWYSVRSFRASFYNGANLVDIARLVLELVFFVPGLLFWLGYTALTLYRWQKRASVWLWFSQPYWNLVDLINKLLLAASAIWYVVLIVQVHRFSESIPEQSQASSLYAAAATQEELTLANQVYRQLDWIAYSSSQFYNFAGINIFVSTLTIFKFMHFNSRTSLLWNTLVRAAGDLFAFLILFFVVFMGFVTTFFLTFGTSLYDFRTLGRSFLSCFQMLLGEFSYEQMEEQGNRVLAPIFFTLYMAIVYFVLINMFLAIITEAYADVHERVQESATLGQSVRRAIARWWLAVKRRGLFYRARAALGGPGYLRSVTVRKYLEQFIRRVNARGYVNRGLESRLYFGPNELERILDAPRSIVDRLYERVRGFVESEDVHYEGEEDDAATKRSSRTNERVTINQIRQRMKNLSDEVAQIDSNLGLLNK